MVFTTVANYIRSKGPDEFWRKRKIFRMAAHFVGRRRNCYSMAIRGVHRALVFATKGRKLRKEDMKELWIMRITAGCSEHELDYLTFKRALRESQINLNKKTLADLAVWEPYSFKALTDIAKRQALDIGLKSALPEENQLTGIISRGALNSRK